MSREWSDEQLSAMLDGELPEAGARDLHGDLSDDPALSARFERLRVANQAFLNDSARIDAQPMPAELSLLLARHAGASHGGLSHASPSNVVPFRRWLGGLLMEHRAIAASLFCAAAIGGLASLRSSAPASAVDDGSPVIAVTSPLGKVLEAGRSATLVSLPAGLAATPRLSFRRADGTFCRQFRLNSSTETTDGVACRETKGWRTELLVFGPAAPAAGDYQSASGPAAGLLEAYVGEQMKGAPLNAADETAAIVNRWQNK